VISTPLKNMIVKLGSSSPRFGVKIKLIKTTTYSYEHLHKPPQVFPKKLHENDRRQPGESISAMAREKKALQAPLPFRKKPYGPQRLECPINGHFNTVDRTKSCTTWDGLKP